LNFDCSGKTGVYRAKRSPYSAPHQRRTRC
jgi:hypothetical protein